MANILSLKKPKRFVLVIISDSHAGHIYGLLNPETTFIEYDEKGEDYEYLPRLTRPQEYLWKLYEEHIKYVKDLADGDPIIVIHNGDLTVGVKYPRQMAFTAISNQIIAAYMNMSPWFDLPNMRAFRIVYGTQSHEFFEGTAPRLVVAKLKDKYPDKDVALVKHGLTSINNIEFDYAHHGPFPGSRKWLEGNVARYYLRDIMMRKMIAGENVSDFYIRSHYHTPVEESLSIRQNGKFVRAKLFITPSYQMLGDYGQQATRSVDSVSNGCIALECIDGKLVDQPHWLLKSSDIRTKEVLKL